MEHLAHHRPVCGDDGGCRLFAVNRGRGGPLELRASFPRPVAVARARILQAPDVEAADTLAAGEVSVSEYAATRVKQAVTGNGRAPKRQVQSMVRRLLALDCSPALDASDALAAAICHAHEYRLRDVGAAGRARPRRIRRGSAVRVGRRP